MELEEEATVTVATGALGPVVAKLKAMLWLRGEYRLRWRTRKDVKLIRSELNSIHSILWAIWEKEVLDAAGKQLRMEAWRLADDMNDAIDDFVLSMKRSNGDFVQSKMQPSPFQDLKKRTSDVSERCRNKWKMETAARTTVVSSLFSRKNTIVNDSGPAKRRPRLVDPYVHKEIPELLWMEEPRDKLIQHLVGEEQSPPAQLKMASILGAAGMGKTTLARLVYEAIKDKFQTWAFVSVISRHDMTEVLASILQQAATQSIPDVPLAATKPTATEKHLVDSISKFLKDKRYLVIIDDIWHCGEWEIIKRSLPDNNLGSRIVTTSRVNAITEMWRDDFDALVYRIENVYWCGEPFSEMMIDMNADMVGEGFDTWHYTVDMCSGKPLALVCMISAVAKEREHREQQGLCAASTGDVQDSLAEQVKRNGIQNTPGFEPLVESLELGYKDLPHHMLKTCLLYCSIYPEDHKFERDDLVRRWIAEGFVRKEEVAKDYFDELVSRGLIVHGYLHPLMRNHLRGKLREDNFIACTCDDIIPSSPMGRLCIDYWPTESSDQADPLSGIDWHHIRSLVVVEGVERVPYERLQHLRMLDLRPYRNVGPYNEPLFGQAKNEDLENQHLKLMCGLLRLRHLFGLYGQQITEIPTEITRLQFLETLEVQYTGITSLPAEIGALKQLMTLDVSWNEGLTELPREIENLQQLATLCFRGANIGEHPWEIIRTLKKLKTLDAGCNSRITKLPKEIGKLQHLETLYLGKTGITELPKEIGKLQYLETLYLGETGITELHCEIENLQRLKALYLCNTGITELPWGIWKLQHLETLDLAGCKVRKVPKEIGMLKKLKNQNAQVGVLPFEAGQLSKVEGLPQCVRQAWKNSDLVSLLAGEILSFKNIEDRFGGDGGLVVGKKQMHIPQWIKEHFNNIASLDVRVCRLAEQDLKTLREMPNLKRLVLRFEAVPRESIAISGEGFAKLEWLTVDSRVPRVTFQEGALPSLIYLTFEFQFYGGPQNTDPVGIKHLVRLQDIYFECNKWYRGDNPCINATIDVVRKEAMEHCHGIRFFVAGKKNEIFLKNLTAQSYEDGNEACSSSGANQIEMAQA